MENSFSGVQREALFQKLAHQTFDLLVIGGGITGSGIALDAVARGMKTVLVEMQDYAAGTSSRSTKLVHGGLRYLKQLEVKMVAEVGKERAVVYENGPHVTTPEWMMLPLHQGGTFGKFSTSLGLRVYDYLAGVKRSERRTMLNAEETAQREPLVKREGLKGSGVYVEYRTDDARLTIEVLKEAVHRGASAVNYAEVVGFLYTEGKVSGVQVKDRIGGGIIEIYAKKIVNAAGPWVDTLREKDRSKDKKRLQLTKGIHLVIDQRRFPLRQAIYFDTPDGRMIFAIPRDGKTYVGTTDTVYQGDMEHPRMTSADRQYVIDAINYMFPSVNITVKDIESSWTGLRPLIYEEGKSASEISRKDEVWQSPSGLITIAGGKLTGYRKMAEMVVDLVVDLFKQEHGASFPSSSTKNMPISGGQVGGSDRFAAYCQRKAREGLVVGFTLEQSERLVRRYGSNIDRLYTLAAQHAKQAAAYRLPLDVFTMLEYAIEEEMAVKPVDFFIRRTGALLFDIAWVKQHKASVIAYMAEKLGWSEELQKQYTEELEKHLHDAVVPVDEEAGLRQA
ncbi:glycerol-3-phosphate dehydrogenase/oxidase [Paenibacillus naphthalenovorans]|uniref:glycerol-3-phosphate dehydrogenase/oxidase n=1 Tax=Paenibacillus naphthalenovorans TaxID=162209 RepID=UPI0010B1710A|nr:FAD-dependent oxidoreductase [Paenibacillus naphthalenovorans]GCL73341.1 glycerol-3-phosphate dehydrogenase/oxidase [Paenibacillus naphthalenovorans]